MSGPTLRCLAVDDEPPARRQLIRLLEEDRSIVVVGEAGDGEQALAASAALKPDLMFLDVKMPTPIWPLASLGARVTGLDDQLGLGCLHHQRKGERDKHERRMPQVMKRPLLSSGAVG